MDPEGQRTAAASALDVPADEALDVAAAARDPEALALVAGGVRWTFAELAEAVRAAGPPPGDATHAHPILAEGTPEVFLALHRALHFRRPFVPLHPRWPEVDRAALLNRWGDLEVPAGLACVVPTSGTTGTPKGVMLGREAFLASAAMSAANLGWQDDDRWILAMPLAHVGGISVVTRCLLARRPVILQAGFDAGAFAEAVARDRATLASLVPTMLARLLDAGWRPPAHLRAVLLGGAGCPPALLDRARTAGVPALTTYGLTECCSQVTTATLGTPPSAEGGAGPPLPGAEVRLVEGDRIQVRSPAVMRGYYPPGAFSAPFTGDGWLETGDHGRLDAGGRLHVLGRRVDRIVTGGENVDPLAVEAVLAGHPKVAAACVYGVADDTWGQTVAALVVPRGDEGDVDPEALLAWAAERLAPHARPRAVRFAEALPTSPSGKVDRKAVAALGAAGRWPA